VRLNKFLSETGAWSRRGADAIIAEGRVTKNGEPAVLGTQVEDGDVIAVDGVAVGPSVRRERPVYIALNKPPGITCTTERHVRGNIIDFVGHKERIFPIGRLDKDSEGLILLTNDGDIVNELLRAEHGHEKQYLVSIDRRITDAFVTKMAGGVDIGDAITKPCRVRRVSPQVIEVVLTQGLNRQIRRMVEALDHKVIALRRVRIMHIELGGLPRGKWRDLTADEIAGLAPPPERAAKPARPASPDAAAKT
jgi:23S rRNA pseudouridine2604 synthase